MKAIGTFFRLIRSNDPQDKMVLLQKLGRFLLPEYRFKWPQMEWWNNRAFNNYLEKFGEIGGLNTDRRWMLRQLLRLVHDIPGDTAECGAYTGIGSYLICAVNSNNQVQKREHHVFDSFEGLSEPGAHDGTYWNKKALASPLHVFHRNLEKFKHVQTHQGWIPEKFSEVKNQKFCLLHIDVDLYQPTLDCMEFFYPRMSPGGLIVCDDYGFTSCPGATKAIDHFLQDKDEKMISLPDGGGFMIKGNKTEKDQTHDY